MTKLPETRIGPSAAAVKRRGRLLSPARYRHPGGVIRLIFAGLVLAGAVAVTAVTHATYAGARAAAVTAIVPSTLAGRVLAGLVQALFAGAAVAAVVVMLRCRRFRLLAVMAGAEARHGASRRLDLAGGRAGGLHVCKRPRLVRRRGAGRPGAVITVGSFDFPKCPARRDLRPGARRGTVPGTGPAEPGPPRAGRSGADGLIPAGVERVE
jgi:hypothetical protein